MGNLFSSSSFSYFIYTDNTHFCCSYLAPEYFMHGKVSDKIDVYAFGVVILELLSGRKPIDSTHPKGQGSLVMWVSYSLIEKLRFIEYMPLIMLLKFEYRGLFFKQAYVQFYFALEF